MDPEKYLPNILILYSKKDQPYKEEVSGYLEALRPEKLFLNYAFRPIEEQPGSWLLNPNEHWDVFITLLSVNLRNDDSYEAILSRLKGEHLTRRSDLATIVLGDCLTRVEQYQNAIILPPNKQPRDNKDYWASPDDFYCTVFKCLEPVLDNASERKTEHEERWLRAKEENTVLAYNLFIQDFKYSRYLREARERRDRVEETELWEKARESKALADYYNYIVHTPLNEHRDEAIEEIARIQADEELIWEDIQHAGLRDDLFRYLAGFPRGKHKKEVEALIEKDLSRDHLEVYDEFPENGSRNNLKYLAYQQMTPSEIHNMEAFLNYQEKLIKRSGVDLMELGNQKYIPTYIVVMMILLIPLSMRVIAQMNKFFLFSIVIVGVWLTLEFIIKWKYYAADMKYIGDSLKNLKYFQILLVIAYSAHNETLIHKIMKHTYAIQKNIEKIKVKTVQDYMKQEKAMEYNDPKSVLPPIRRND